MAQVDWQIVKDVLYEALSRPADERASYLDSKCSGDNDLRSEVEYLLESYESGFLERPALAGLSAKDRPGPPLLEIGSSLSHYRIIQLLGRGGMGEVYLATDLSLDRLAAIKVIHGESGFGDQSAARLLREARSAAKLDHPNICQVYEVGEAEGHPFIAMQFVEGEMLDRLIAAGPIAFDDAVSYARQTAAALAKAHAYGIVHRDIKPSNIIVDPQKQIKVLDFGLAKETDINSAGPELTTQGLIAGTVTYMSPEHARGQEIDGRTDVWSLGVVLYQMLTGRLPFRGGSRADLISAILNDEPAEAEELPAALRYIIGRALEKDTAIRYADIAEFEADLAEFEESGKLSRPGITLPVAATANKRNAILRSALPVIVLLAMVGGGFGVWRYRSAAASGEPFARDNRAGIQTSTIYETKLKNEGVAYGLIFSPDGSMLAYSSNDAEIHDFGIFVASVAGGEPVRLTGKGTVNYSPLWSPDGQRIAYLSSADGGRSVGIWSVPFTGGEPTLMQKLAENKRGLGLLKWSNDGTSIFVGYENKIDRVDLATGETTPLDLSGIEGAVGGRFSISPDETLILALSISGKEPSVWLRSINVPDARKIPFTGTPLNVPQWFPDGRHIAYATKKDGLEQTLVQGVGESESRQISSGVRDGGVPAISPSGGRVAYISTTNEANLFATEIGKSDETEITSKTTVQTFPSISPDGKRIAYGMINEPAFLGLGTFTIEPFMSTPANGNGTLIQNASWAKWLPDGNSLIFIRTVGELTNIWTYDTALQVERQVSTMNVMPVGYSLFPLELIRFPVAIAADGKTIAYVSDSSGSQNLWTVGIDGSDEKMVTGFTEKTDRVYSPRWSGDGRLAFIRVAGGGVLSHSPENHILVWANGAVTEIAVITADMKILGWTQTNDGVYVSAGADGRWDVYLVPADGSPKRIVAALPDAVQHSMRLSPDRRSVVYTRRTGGVDDLYLVPLGGGEGQRITNNKDQTIHFSGPTWTPDGGTLVYSKQSRGMQIMLLTDKNASRTN